MIQIKTKYGHSDPMIVLVGPMGAGKSTVGRKLAQRIGLNFIDIDKEIESSAGMSITKIFKNEGEEGFRKKETDMISFHCCKNGTVISTGGGAILSLENRMMMRNGIVVYLHATPNQQYDRIKNRKHRPKLDRQRPLAKLAELMEIRDPLYRSEADIIVRTDGQSVDEVASQIEHGLLNQ